ncbi:AraC family transcriptional regulator [Negadavirga shengliensis]|uniref:AraC family transcriptional regulator n=1 Tax=Negadavirga shengliensis TaxID=1389218 RepID=A0ABV9T410_9BACT
MDTENPRLVQLQTKELSSFLIGKECIAQHDSTWHFHPEIELVQVSEGKGKLQVGKHEVFFHPGRVFILGSFVPHCWKLGDSENNEIHAIHFRPDFWGDRFLGLPENQAIRSLLETAKKGIRLHKKDEEIISGLFRRVFDSEGSTRIIALLEMLTCISKCEKSFILPPDFMTGSFQDHSDLSRIDRIMHFTHNNFKRNILLHEAASLAGMNPNYFCRYFKAKTGKTYFQYLSEIRVRHACALILEKKLSLKQICFESGFNNIQGFYKAFKKITGKSPLKFYHDLAKKI